MLLNAISHRSLPGRTNCTRPRPHHVSLVANEDSRCRDRRARDPSARCVRGDAKRVGRSRRVAVAGETLDAAGGGAKVHHRRGHVRSRRDPTRCGRPDQPPHPVGNRGAGTSKQPPDAPGMGQRGGGRCGLRIGPGRMASDDRRRRHRPAHQDGGERGARQRPAVGALAERDAFVSAVRFRRTFGPGERGQAAPARGRLHAQRRHPGCGAADPGRLLPVSRQSFTPAGSAHDPGGGAGESGGGGRAAPGGPRHHRGRAAGTDRRESGAARPPVDRGHSPDRARRAGGGARTSGQSSLRRGLKRRRGARGSPGR